MTENELSGEEIDKPIIKEKRKKSSNSSSLESSVHSFPIVGIGCSAGGLEALEQFLSHVPPDTGMAFIIIQHQDPTHQGILTELLQRITQIPVTIVTDSMEVSPDMVYVIPPNKDMSLLNGNLYLLDPVSPRGLRLPIDLFFRSLAEEMRERAIGVILSGMGTDGTLGLKAIKEKAGVVFVQDPQSAKFNGMPLSAIDAGLADFVIPAEEIPETILAYCRNTPLTGFSIPSINKHEASGLEKVIIIVRIKTGHDFSQYKSSTLYRRIERRMGIHKLKKINQYVRYLQENPQEVELLFKEFLIGVTNFFRDPEAWDQFKYQAIMPLVKRHSLETPIRVWVPGCSTGEEAYSVAMVINEILDEIKSNHEGFLPTIQIYATDIDSVAIEKARLGYYPVNIVADVSPERITRFFIREEDGFRIRKEIRETVVFAVQNLIMDPPFTKLDIISCRNLLIYFSGELQKKILPLFHYSLYQGGILFLGSAESIGTFTDLFKPVDPKTRIFIKNETLIPKNQLNFPSMIPSALPGSPLQKVIPSNEKNLEDTVHAVLLDQYTPPAVLVNEQGDILFVNGKTGKYLEMSAGKANMNIYSMAKESIRYELTTAFAKVLRERDPVMVHGLKLLMSGTEQMIDLSLQKIKGPGICEGAVLIVFTDIPVLDKKKPRKKTISGDIQELEQENQHLREELSTFREEMQTSQEELRSANEELQSTNEELQSTNEELTTSKEEMQSLNEELQTVNSELQARVEALSLLNNDMKNLLNSTDIATIFLDNELNVRRFTTKATAIIRLIGSDIGRPITDLATSLQYPDLVFDANEVLRTLVFIEKVVHSDDGRWFTVKIMPYRTLDNRIDGLVFTFIEITKSKQIEEKMLIDMDEQKRIYIDLSNEMISKRDLDESK